MTHVYEFDAKIETELTTLSSRVDGTIERVHVREGDAVAAGTVLVSMDAAVERLRIEALRNDLARERAHIRKLTTEKEALELSLKSRAATKREEIAALTVEQDSARQRLDLATQNLDRSRILVNKELISSNLFEKEQDKTLDLEGKAAVAAAKIRVAESELAEIAASGAEVDVLLSELDIAEANMAKFEILIREGEEKLKQRLIVSPVDGVVASVFKFAGEHVLEGDRVMLLHDPKSFWIEAKIEESQLRHLRVGQNVLIDIDAYPFDSFAGRVTRIGSLTTAQIERESPSGGRGGKTVQRIPVYIELLDPPDRLAPGMMVEVNIAIYDGLRFR